MANRSDMVVPPHDGGADTEQAGMTMPSWDRVKQVFQAALEREPHDRAAYVRDMCGKDRGLLAEVESLLATHEEAGSFAERPAIEGLDALEHTSDSETLTSGA